jgi:hypothetical protein
MILVKHESTPLMPLASSSHAKRDGAKCAH